MKTKLDHHVKKNVFSLLDKISNENNKEKKSYLFLRLYLMVVYIQNNFHVGNDKDNEFLDKLFLDSVNHLTQYFNCNPVTLPSRILSTLGREVIPFFNSIDKIQSKDNLMYLTRKEANYFKTIIDEGNIRYKNVKQNFQQNEREFVFSLSGDIYVFDIEIQNILSGGDINKRMKHSSFLSGDELLCAGMVKIVDNKIVEISNESGHYRPSHKDIAIFVNHLDSLGVDLSQIKLKLLWPTLNINASTFLSHYPELQSLKNSSFESYETIRKEAAKLNRARDVLNDEHSEIQHLCEMIDKEVMHCLKVGLDENNKELADLLFNLWFDNYGSNPYSSESIALLYRIDGVPITDKQYFNKKMIENNFESLTQLRDDVDRSIEGEVNVASTEKFDPVEIAKFLSNLKDYITTNRWEVTYRVPVLFGKNSKPSTVQTILTEIIKFENNTLDPIKTYDKILQITKNAADNPHWKRKPSTQKFYEKILNNDLFEEFQSKATPVNES